MSNIIPFPIAHGQLKDAVVAIPLPGYMTRKGQIGVAFTDTTTGVSWCYTHGWHSGRWSFHAPLDEPDAYYGTSDGYVPKPVLAAAAPIIASFPPFKPTTYHEDYV